MNPDELTALVLGVAAIASIVSAAGGYYAAQVRQEKEQNR